jgi:hypothetical protein
VSDHIAHAKKSKNFTKGGIWLKPVFLSQKMIIAIRRKVDTVQN